MAPKASSGADALRAAAADLELLAQAVAARDAAEEHLTEVTREVRDRRLVTMEQIGEALRIDRRSVYKRLAR